MKGLVSKTWLTLTLRPQIPHIMHQIFLAGAVKYRRQTLTGRIKESYRKSCLEKHAHWEHHFWARSEAEDLVKQDFPWFWHTWTGYKEWVSRPLTSSDAPVAQLVCCVAAAAGETHERAYSEVTGLILMKRRPAHKQPCCIRLTARCGPSQQSVPRSSEIQLQCSSDSWSAALHVLARTCLTAPVPEQVLPRP